MSQEALQQAQALLRQERYDEARAILEPVADDPTAQKWLARLDEIAPRPAPAPEPVPVDALDEFDDFDDLEDIAYTPAAPQPPQPAAPQNNYDAFDASQQPARKSRPSKPHATNKRFGALQTISAAYKVFAVLVGVVGVLGALFTLVSTATSPFGDLGTGLVVAVPTLLGAVIAAVTLFAFGELIDAFISIEHNTRSSTKLQEQILEELRQSR